MGCLVSGLAGHCVPVSVCLCSAVIVILYPGPDDGLHFLVLALSVLRK